MKLLGVRIFKIHANHGINQALHITNSYLVYTF